MPRVKVTEEPQHGVRQGTAGGTRSQPKGIGTRKRTGNSPANKKKKKPKQRTYLSKDDQAALLVAYMELPKETKKKGDTRRSDALTELCKEYDVAINYPRKLYDKIKSEGKLSTRDGVAGAPQRITDEEEVCLRDTLRTHGYDLTYRQLETLTGIPVREARRPIRHEVSCVQVHHRG